MSNSNITRPAGTGSNVEHSRTLSSTRTSEQERGLLKLQRDLRLKDLENKHGKPRATLMVDNGSPTGVTFAPAPTPKKEEPISQDYTAITIDQNIPGEYSAVTADQAMVYKALEQYDEEVRSRSNSAGSNVVGGKNDYPELEASVVHVRNNSLEHQMNQVSNMTSDYDSDSSDMTTSDNLNRAPRPTAPKPVKFGSADTLDQHRVHLNSGAPTQDASKSIGTQKIAMLACGGLVFAGALVGIGFEIGLHEHVQ